VNQVPTSNTPCGVSSECGTKGEKTRDKEEKSQPVVRGTLGEFRVTRERKESLPSQVLSTYPGSWKDGSAKKRGAARERDSGRSLDPNKLREVEDLPTRTTTPFVCKERGV